MQKAGTGTCGSGTCGPGTCAPRTCGPGTCWSGTLVENLRWLAIVKIVNDHHVSMTYARRYVRVVCSTGRALTTFLLDGIPRPPYVRPCWTWVVTVGRTMSLDDGSIRATVLDGNVSRTCNDVAGRGKQHRTCDRARPKCGPDVRRRSTGRTPPYLRPCSDGTWSDYDSIP